MTPVLGPTPYEPSASTADPSTAQKSVAADRTDACPPAQPVDDGGIDGYVSDYFDRQLWDRNDDDIFR